MSTDASRRNVGAYVLGVLDADEMTSFEAHLAECDRCAGEVERLLPTALALSEVSPNQAIALHMISDDSPVSDLPTLDELPALDEPADPIRERRRPTTRPAARTDLQPLPFVPRRSGAGELVRRAVARTTALHRKQPVAPRHGQPNVPRPARPPRPSRLSGPARRTNQVGLLSGLAAAGVLLLVFLIGTQLAGGGPQVAHGDVTPAPATDAADPATSGPDGGAPRRQFDVLNPVSRVRAVMSVTDATWGSQISLSLYGVVGPLRCDLVAIGRDGQPSVVASWNVPAPGRGLPNDADPLSLQAATAMALRDIREFRIRATAADGTQSTLVTIVV